MYTGGYMGRILRINLDTETATVEDLSTEWAEQFLGGVGFGFKVLYDELKAGIDPLGPENKLIFSIGPFTGTGIPCTSRMAVCSKSPLTGTIAVSMTGGNFPLELKKSGFDSVVIEGSAKRPTYLFIKDGKVAFKAASKLKGMTTTDCQHFLKDELNDGNIRIACVGPAGENLVRMASIINERRAAGRKGLGAVMGSKNLKAIAVRGSHNVAIANKEGFDQARKQMLKAMKESPVLYSGFAKTGTPSVVDLTGEMGILAAKNWTATGEFVPIKEIGLEAQQALRVRKYHCSDCPVGCSQVKMVKEGPYAGMLAEGPEFETTYSLGTQTGVDYLPAIIAGDRLCDEYGIDTMSSGIAIGFAMELFEKGVLTKEDTDGLELRFGNHEAMLELIKKIAYKEGIGAVLSEGVKRASEKIGKESSYFALHVKGLELPAYDVRGAKAHGLNYATACNGADHNRGYAFQEIFGIPVPEEVDRFAVKGKGILTKWNQDVRTATCDCSALCAFILDTALAGIACELVAKLATEVSGLTFTAEGIQQIGERVNNVARLFNTREGFNRKDDILPPRLMTEPIKMGASKGQLISQGDLDEMLDEYYEARGWDQKTGEPTEPKLRELDLK